MNSIEKRLIRLNGTQSEEYSTCVDRRIREKYSLSAELAIIRQRDTKPEEFAAYNAYVEAVKAEVKLELGIREVDA